MKDYDRGNLPRLVQCTINKGYTMSHRGMLYWATVLSNGIQIPIGRLRFLALEATLAFIFFAAHETKLDGAWTGLLPWKRSQVAWLPLCTNTAPMERPAS